LFGALYTASWCIVQGMKVLERDTDFGPVVVIQMGEEVLLEANPRTELVEVTRKCLLSVPLLREVLDRLSRLDNPNPYRPAMPTHPEVPHPSTTPEVE
jgi:hypothetical protein